MTYLLFAVISVGVAPAMVVAQEKNQTDVLASPETYLGRSVGTDFQLADWSQVQGFYRQLAEKSPRVELQRVGTTSEGRDFLVAIISDESNLANLDAIRNYSRQIADPRELSDEQKREAVSQGKVIVFVTPTMHSTEVAATEMGMQLAYLLATSDEEPWRSTRSKAVVVITPSLNPDGVDHVVNWYREHLGTELESASLTRLYQLYTGHDNNRDWFMLSQAETRLLSQLIYREWFPQILWDVHQQGNRTERFFVPPYRDPLNPNLDPAIVAGINLIGSRAVLDMTRNEISGVATGVSYDNWWNGGNRSVPARHNIIGILTEAASANIASPIFQSRSALKDPLGTSRYQPSNQFVKPWPGGWWRVGDIIEYELQFARSLFGSISREPEFWLRNKLEAAQRTLNATDSTGSIAWLIPSDAHDIGATRRLLEALIATGVEVHVSESDFEADGRRYPEGTLVLFRQQPAGNYVQDLFELQDFPSGSTPYDVTGWTLPLLLGVRRVQVRQPFEADLRLAQSASDAVDAWTGDARLSLQDSTTVRASDDSDSWRWIVERLSASEKVTLVTEPPYAGLFVASDFESGEEGHEPESTDVDAQAESDEKSSKVTTEEPAVASNPESLPTDKDVATASGILAGAMPRIGVYAPWSPSMDEGWLRWVLDNFEIPFATLRNDQIRAGRLGEMIDVLIIPSISASLLNQGLDEGSTPIELTGGLDPEGALAIETFVFEGGTLVAMDNSAAWAIELLELPVVDATRSAKGFSCPGSVLRGVAEPHALTTGLPRDIPLFFSESAAWRPMTTTERESAQVEERPYESLLKYGSTRLLLSGYIDGAETLEGKDALVSLPHGEGRAFLFGFRPHYRAWTQATFHLLFRAIFFGSADWSEKME